MGNLAFLCCCCSKRAKRHRTISNEPTCDNENNLSEPLIERCLSRNEHAKTVEQIVIKPGDSVLKRISNPENDYENIRDLGEGSFGRVILAKHRETGNMRAIKIINKEGLKDELQNEEIENEIRVLKSLDHPNIIKIYEFYDYKGAIYIVNEFCEDGDLFNKLEKLNYLSEELVLKIMYQVFSSISYLHSEKVVHGDIKPENIMIDNLDKYNPNNFDIKLIDFGTSRMFNKSRTLDGIVGTVHYIAPEVILGGYKEQCDLWSCGVLLYVLLSGRYPFDGEVEEEVFKLIENGDYSTNFPEFKKVSSDTLDLLSKLLNIYPLDRITAQQALEHQAIKRAKQSSSNEFGIRKDSLDTLKRLKAIGNQAKFQQSITTFITHNFIDKKNIEKYRKIFQAMDENGDGRLSHKELLDSYHLLGQNYTEHEINEIITNIDKDNNGYIEYEEFISATIDKSVILSEKNIRLAFEAVDEDKSGFISFDEIKKFIGGGLISDELLLKIINEIGKEKEDQINLQDFSDIMKKIM